jgi:hypothetical protein
MPGRCRGLAGREASWVRSGLPGWSGAAPGLAVPAARELFPDDFATKPNFLCFLFFVLQAS